MRRPLSIVALGWLCAMGCRPTAPVRYTPSPEEQAWNAAHEAENRGDDEAALEAYARLCDATKVYVRACFDRVRLMYDIRPIETTRKASVALIERFPDNALTQKAVKQLAKSFEREGAYDDGIAALEALAEPRKGQEIRDTLLFEIAKLARDGGRSSVELHALERIVREHDRFSSQLWDDAVWRLAKRARERGAVDDEKKWIQTLLDERESSWLIGSYTSPFDDDAFLRLAHLYVDEHNYQGAYEAFRALSKMTASRLAIQGKLGCATMLIRLRRGREACELLKQIVLEKPPKKPLREAQKLIGQAACGPK